MFNLQYALGKTPLYARMDRYIKHLQHPDSMLIPIHPKEFDEYCEFPKRFKYIKEGMYRGYVVVPIGSPALLEQRALLR